MEGKNLENLFEAAKRVALTPEEKSASREMLRSYMALTPKRTTAASDAATAKRAPRFAFVHFGKAASVFSLVLVLTLSAAGASYAAEGALPGDMLYPVKVSVNEEVRAAFTASSAEKAKWEAARAGRRLAEAEALFEKGELKAETRAELEVRFKRHAERAHLRIERIREKHENGAVIAAEVTADLGGTLDAHGEIVAALVAEQGGEEVALLAASIATETEAADGGHADTDGDEGVAEAEKEEMRVAAEIAAKKRRETAERKAVEIRAYLKKMRGDGRAEPARGDARKQPDIKIDSRQESEVRVERILPDLDAEVKIEGTLRSRLFHR